MNMFARTGWISMIATMALMIGSGMVARSIPYETGFGAKQLAWAAHCTIMVLDTVFIVYFYAQTEYRWTDSTSDKF